MEQIPDHNPNKQTNTCVSWEIEINKDSEHQDSRSVKDQVGSDKPDGSKWGKAGARNTDVSGYISQLHGDRMGLNICDIVDSYVCLNFKYEWFIAENFRTSGPITSHLNIYVSNCPIMEKIETMLS